MNKVNGKKKSFAPIREDGSRITICYGLKKLSGNLYEWLEVYLPKNQLSQLTLAGVKNAIINDIDEAVREGIISGFTYQGEPVWLSIENQLNFASAVAPSTLKIGELEDGTPVYKAFHTAAELEEFNSACNDWKQQRLAEGWTLKDGIDWAPYEAYFSE